jgi:hypothetical protein
MVHSSQSIGSPIRFFPWTGMVEIPENRGGVGGARPTARGGMVLSPTFRPRFDSMIIGRLEADCCARKAYTEI